MIRKVLAALALGSALTVCVPASIYAADRDDHRSEVRHDDREQPKRSDHDRDDRNRYYQSRDGYRGDGDRDDRYRNPSVFGYYSYPTPYVYGYDQTPYVYGYYDQFGYWHPYTWAW